MRRKSRASKARDLDEESFQQSSEVYATEDPGCFQV